MTRHVAGIRFHRDELRDLGIAWLALGVAFAIFFAGGGSGFVQRGDAPQLLLVSLLTAGIGFLLHELAHKVVAVRFGQAAEFRADYGMLFLAVAAATAGFLFAAPGAVYHRGRLTARQAGLIALAGPVTNVVLGLAFVPLLFVPVDVVVQLGVYGTLVNFVLAAFNMLPFGPLDGKTVRQWSTAVFAVAFLVSAALGALAVLVVL